MSLRAKEAELYPAHRANIHEKRAAAVVARATPLVLFLGIGMLSIYGVFRYQSMLLMMCAILNTSLWLYLVSSALFSILGARKAWSTMQECELVQRPPPEVRQEAGTGSVGASGNIDDEESQEGGGTGAEFDGGGSVAHLIVLPNYKEDEAMLGQTLVSISEAAGSSEFRVVLGMEQREGPEAVAKAKNLKEKYGHCFAWLEASFHPKNLVEEHMDGSADPEVPGKASNLKWAVNFGYEVCRKEGTLNLDRIVLTVADADCLFHPSYFNHISKDYTSKEFNEMRAAAGSEHMYTMWQAPQMPYRNYYTSPVPSRTWGYLATTDEFGGITSLAYGGHHMVFSGYSLPLRLAIDAQPWDGDVVAEDHHAYVRCFFYSVHAAALDTMTARTDRFSPALRVRPVFLPVKSTSVASSEGYWQSWVERYHQARRHMQGISELSYALLATYDLLSTLPLHLHTLQLHVKLFRVLNKLFCMHLLPTLQSVALGVLSLYWLWNKKQVPQCPESIMMVDSRGEMLLCGLAGAWVLVWPVFVPLCLFVIANYLFMASSFIGPAGERRAAGRKLTVWHGEDGGCPPLLGSVRLMVFVMIALDTSVCMMVLAIPYAFIPEVLAYWHNCFHGNKIKYITAAKLLDPGSPTNTDYGSTAGAGPGGRKLA
mmetsp:Transcript_56363/g.180965  ORF Transcript_56363/g.180965 Transcript_56363/m.180965 type:complete len:654 (+) Transcript_56363:69-2030(+)